VTQDSADQRAGRAGRLGPGAVRRLWDARDRLRPHREPDIQRVDLASSVLEIVAWGGNPAAFEWFETPPAGALDAAIALLEQLGVLANGALTRIGDQVRALPLHPRLARMLVASGSSRDVARACALLSERHQLPRVGTAATTSSDLLSALDQWPSVSEHVKHVATRIQSEFFNPKSEIPWSEATFRRAILAGYPDRVGQRRQAGSSSALLSSGTGATFGRESGVRDAEWFVALDVHTSDPSHGPLIRMASAIEREWLSPTASAVEHRFDAASGRVRAREVGRYGALVLAERHVAPEPQIAAGLLAAAWLARGPQGEDERLLKRLRFAKLDVKVDDLVRAAALEARSLDEVELAAPCRTTSLVRSTAKRPTPSRFRADVPIGSSITMTAR
jgi:ATP-dependent helicase HrpB